MSNRTYSAVPSDFKGAAGFPYIFDPAYVLTTGVPKPITGAWRPWATSDITSNNISLTGSSFNISNIAVTGGSINIAGGSIAITNPLIAVSGIVTANTIDSGNRAVQVVNTAPIPFSGVTVANTVDTGIRAVNVTNTAPIPFSGSVMNIGGFIGITGVPSVTIPFTSPVYVTGSFASTLSSATAITGAPVVTLTGVTSVSVDYTRPVYVTGSFSSAPANTVITGFNSTISPLAVSGNFTSTPGNTAITGFNSTISPLAVSGVVQAQVVLGPLAVTGFNSTIAPLAVSGIVTALTVDTGIRAVNVVNTIAQSITGTVQTVDPTGNLLLASISGSLVSLLADNAAITGFNSTIAPLAISGVVSTTVTVGNVAITGYVNTIDTTGNLYLAAVSGLLAANLAGSAPVTGDIRNIPGTVLAISGVVQASVSTVDTGNRSVFVVNQATINSGGWVGVTGFSSLIAPLAISGVVNTTVSISNVAVTGFPSTIAPLAISGVVNTAVTVSNVAITGFNSLIAPLAVSGVFSATATVGNVAITGFGSLIAPLAISGIVTTNVGNLAITGGQMNVAITGGVLSTTSANPVGVTGVAYDRNFIYSGINTYNFVPMGGRVANPSGIGAITGGYATGAFAMLNLSPQGALFVSQGNLNPLYDQITSFAASSGLLTTSIVSGGAGALGAGLALPNNPNRRAWFIGNAGTGVLMVRFSATPPTTGTYNLLLKGGSLGLDGNGASWTDSPAVYTGPVSVSGVVPGFVTSFNVWEL